MEFRSFEDIMQYNFTKLSEVNQALNDLERMHDSGYISDYQYENTEKLLEDKRDSL